MKFANTREWIGARIERIATEPMIDLAVIAIEKPDQKYPTVRGVSDSIDTPVGGPVSMIGYPLGTDLTRVKEFHDRGGRYLSLAHNGHNQLADSHTGEAILQLFRNLSQHGRTIVLETHDPEIAAVTPRRIEIRDGKIAGKIDLTLAGLAGAPSA